MDKSKYYLSADMGSEYIKLILFENDLINKEIKPTKPFIRKVEESELNSQHPNRCIKETLKQMVEEMKLPQLEEIYVSINNQNIISDTIINTFTFDKPTVISKEILQQLGKQTQAKTEKNEELIYIRNNKYIIDGKMDVINPLLMEAKSIKSEVFIVKIKKEYLDEIDEIFDYCGLKVNSIIPGIVAQGEILLTAQEKSLGACLIDVGYTTTDVICYNNSNISVCFSLNLGISDFIESICSILKVKYKDAYYMFMENANLLQVYSESSVPYLNMFGEKEAISLGCLNKIIEDLIKQLFRTVNEIFRTNNLNIHAFTLSGGLTNIQGIKNTISQSFNIHRIKIGKINDIKLADLANNKWATCFGMMQISTDNVKPKSNQIYNIIYNIKTFLDNILK